MNEVLGNTLMITGFVFVMMLVIEYVNVLSAGRWGSSLAGNRWGQYLLAAALGAVPGCLGVFAVVAMFSHRVIGLGAVITAMIATSGDEAFVMLAVMPREAIVLAAILVLVGIAAGVFTDSMAGRVRFLERLSCDGLQVHRGHEGVVFSRAGILAQWRNCTPARGILAAALALLVAGIVTGLFTTHFHNCALAGREAVCEHHTHAAHEPGGHDHTHDPARGDHGPGHDPDQAGHVHHHDDACAEHGHVHDAEGGGWDWIRVTLLVTSLLALLIVVTVPDHFLDEHLWRHIAMRHLPRIFLWTLGAIVVLYLVTTRLHVDLALAMVRGRWFVLLVACLLGVIPQSGPHLIFVTMFVAGYVPFSILLASSIVQDGHGMLPLLAYSRRMFLLIKAINLIFGLAVGAAALAAGI